MSRMKPMPQMVAHQPARAGWSGGKPPRTPRVATAEVPPNDDDIKRVFTYVKDGVPASLCIGTKILDNREAIGAACLCAQEFCDWAMSQLNKPKGKKK